MNIMDEVWEDMKSGVCNFTNNGECSNCGACCTNLIPISAKEVKAIKRYVKKNHIKEQVKRYPFAGNVIDLTCPFRDDANKVCTIYPVRPLICRDFKCDKTMQGIQATKEFLHDKYSVVEMRKTFFEK